MASKKLNLSKTEPLASEQVPPPELTLAMLEAESQAAELEALGAPPEADPKKLKRHREKVQRKVARYRERMKIATVEEFVREELRARHPDRSADTLAQPLHALIPLMERFDWRRYKVTPFVRDQGDCLSCWAHVSTEAFESSLNIQQANFARFNETRRVFEVTKISLSVKTTLDCVQPRNCGAGGRHEKAFKHYMEFGVPLKGINVFPHSDQHDPDFGIGVGNCTKKEKTGIKAIGWDYVHLPPHEIPSVMEIKEALLEHGPLVSMVSNDGFSAYRHPDNDDDKVGMPDFSVDTAPVFEKKTEKVPNHYVLIIGWDDTKVNEKGEGVWIIQNTFGAKWGYQCDGPREMNNDFRSHDRGFMYIRWGSNHIGKFATWIDAPLLSQWRMKKIKKQSTQNKTR